MKPFFDEVGQREVRSSLLSSLSLKAFDLKPDIEDPEQGKASLAPGIVSEADRRWFNSNWVFDYEFIQDKGGRSVTIYLPDATLDGVGIDGTLSKGNASITLHDSNQGDFVITGELACGIAMFLILGRELVDCSLKTFLGRAPEVSRWGGVDAFWLFSEFFEREADIAEGWAFEAGGWKWGFPEEWDVYTAEHIASGKPLGLMLYFDDDNSCFLRIYKGDWNCCVFDNNIGA